MKNVHSLALVLAALAAPLFPQSTRAEAEVSFEYFQEALSPFGEWIEVADYGLCWRPTGVGEDWAPYTDGYWAYTDAGWTWVSYEDWGGITYHYGRWVHVVGEGWVWVPDDQWGPAWVSWRSSDDYVGWAPLPPEARWEENTGFSVWVDSSYDIGPDSYRFCRTRDFGAPLLAPILVPCEQNVTIILSTVNITNITFNHHNSVVFCGGPNFVSINRHLRRPIPSLKLVCEARGVRGDHGHRPPQVVRGNQLAVYAPKVTRPADLKALPITPRRIVGADKINRGWSRVPDLAAQQAIKQRLQKQTAGLDPRTAPARPVKPADLSSVPKKAEPNVPSPNVVVRDRSGSQRTPLRPTIAPAPVQPQRPVAGIEIPRVGENPAPIRVEPGANPPKVAERVRPSQERPENVARPVPPRPFNNPPPQVSERQPQPNLPPSRPPQLAVPDERARQAEAGRARVQEEQNAQRAARQQQEAAQRAGETRSRQVQQQQSEAAQRANEARRQQVLPQRQQPQQADAARQQQEAVQRANETRRQQVPQIEAARQQQQAAQRANEVRNQQSQQAEAARSRQNAAVERVNEMRQQQAQRSEAAQRQQAVPPSRPASPPQSSQAPAKDGDDDKKKQRSGR